MNNLIISVKMRSVNNLFTITIFDFKLGFIKIFKIFITLLIIIITLFLIIYKFKLGNVSFPFPDLPDQTWTTSLISKTVNGKSSNDIIIFSPLDPHWYNSLSLIQQISFNMILLNTVTLGCLINIIFALFGDYLIKRWSLEKRWPKLSKLIELRKTFQKYYLILNTLIIICSCLIQIIFGIAVLSL